MGGCRRSSGAEVSSACQEAPTGCASIHYSTDVLNAAAGCWYWNSTITVLETVVRTSTSAGTPVLVLQVATTARTGKAVKVLVQYRYNCTSVRPQRY
jgi:hypothetical protein